MTLVEIRGHTLIGSALSPDSVILDLGAHKGQFAQEIIETYGCRVYAVEANPVLAEQMPRHPRLAVHHLAIAGENGRITLQVSDNLEASTILQRPGKRAVSVEAMTLPTFLGMIDARRVDLVKFDIEGAEIDALDACSSAFLQTIPQITVEFHDFLALTPVPTIRRVVERLESLGFFTLKMWRSAWGDTLFVNRNTEAATTADLQIAKWVTRPWRWVQHRVERAGGHQHE